MQQIYDPSTIENRTALSEWASTKLAFGKELGWETATRLRQSWEEFSSGMNVIPARPRDIAAVLLDRGAISHRSGTRGRFWIGVRCL